MLVVAVEFAIEYFSVVYYLLNPMCVSGKGFLGDVYMCDDIVLYGSVNVGFFEDCSFVRIIRRLDAMPYGVYKYHAVTTRVISD
jgi:hypothetical protein